MGEVQAEMPLVEAKAPATAVITPPRVRAGASVRTYRYLRLSLVGLVLLLPWTRALIYRLLAHNLKVVEVSSAEYRSVDPGMIELNPKDWRDGPSL